MWGPDGVPPGGREGTRASRDMLAGGRDGNDEDVADDAIADETEGHETMGGTAVPRSWLLLLLLLLLLLGGGASSPSRP